LGRKKTVEGKKTRGRKEKSKKRAIDNGEPKSCSGKNNGAGEVKGGRGQGGKVTKKKEGVR